MKNISINISSVLTVEKGYLNHSLGVRSPKTTNKLTYVFT